MGFTTAGLALLFLGLMLLFNWTTRTALVIAAILGAIIPLTAQIASGVSTLGSSVAPVFNSLSSGLG